MTNGNISHRKLALLHWEVANIQEFLNEFELLRNGDRRKAILGHTGEFIIVRNLPLPDRYRPDYVDVLLIVDNFPDTPPIGLYLLNKGNGEVTRQISTKMNAFRNSAHHDAVSINGYTWICYAYQGNSWRYRADSPSRGDNVRKFLNAFYSEIS
jgi:hypothetical protein